MEYSDLALACQVLEAEGLSLCAVRDGQVVFRSQARGVACLARLVLDQSPVLRGACVADAVVGRAAQMLYTALDPVAVYAKLYSTNARSWSTAFEVIVGHEVPAILNRDQNGPCPMEVLSALATTPLEMAQAAADFMAQRGKTI